MNQWQKVLLEIRMRHQERVNVQQLKLPKKSVGTPNHLKVPFRHLATQQENVQKRKREILTELQAVKRLKFEMRKEKRLQRRLELHLI